MREISNKIDFAYDSVDEAFPKCDPGVEPFGSRILVQVRTPKKKTKGGIILTGEVREIEHYNTQVAKVIAMGPLAFHNRDTMKPWVEGLWCSDGDFVRVPRYGGDRWTVNYEVDGEEESAVFVIFNDLDIIGRITGDPLAMRAFL